MRLSQVGQQVVNDVLDWWLVGCRAELADDFLEVFKIMTLNKVGQIA